MPANTLSSESVAPQAPGQPVEVASRFCASQQTGALVLGGDHRALGIARSLGRRSIPVWVLSSKRDLLAASSRYVRRHLHWPQAAPAEQIGYLIELADKYQLAGWVLIPTADDTAALVAQHSSLLAAKFRLTTPEWESMSLAYDKRLTYRMAAELAVACPRTGHSATWEGLRAVCPAFPCILKPAIKEEQNPFTIDKAWRVDDRAALELRYRQASQYISPELILLQELIPGGGDTQFSYVALCRNGEPLAWMTARRTRQYPADFGHSSTLVETVDRPEIEVPARRVLARMRYTGVVEVEFKYDVRDRQYKLLDINPRFWTWHSLCGRAGVDFPYLLWRLSRGEDIPALRGRPGFRWLRVSTDLLSAAGEIRQGRLSPRAYWRSLRGPVEFAAFSLDDPLPWLADLPLAAWRRLIPE